MKITENDAKQFVRTMYELYGGKEKIRLEDARAIANWLDNHCGLPVTPLIVERIWNEFALAENEA